MIALDTNILVRLLVADDAAQLARSQELLETQIAAGGACLVSHPVLCELEWMLDSCYRVSRARILEMLQEMLATPCFEFESRAAVRAALAAYQAGKADFSDYLIGQIARERNASATYTFDRGLRGAEGFTVL